MKKWIMFCLTLLISVSLVACGNSEDNGNEEPNNDNNAPINGEQEDTNTEDNTDSNNNSEENDDSDVNSDENTNSDANSEDNTNSDINSGENADSGAFEVDPTGENVVTLETEENGVVMRITYTADGDKVTKQTADNVLPYAALNVTTPEEAEEALAEIVAGFQGIEGVTHSMDYQDDKVIETLTVDYEKADMKDVSELTGSSFEGDVSQGVSLTRSVEMLQQQGFVIVD